MKGYIIKAEEYWDSLKEMSDSELIQRQTLLLGKYSDAKGLHARRLDEKLKLITKEKIRRHQLLK